MKKRVPKPGSTTHDENAGAQADTMFHDLFENSINAVAIHEIILDEHGTPVDYIFLKANKAFEKHTKLPVADIIGKRVTETHPGIEKSGLIEIYGKVALTGEPTAFETFFEPSQKYYNIKAFRVGTNRFAAVFDDITERKNAEERERYLKLILLAIRNINQLIVREYDTRSLIWQACAEFFDTLGYYNAWIVLLDSEGTPIDLAASGIDEAVFEDFRQSLFPGKPGAAGNPVALPKCVRSVLKSKKLFVTGDVLATCGTCPLAGEYEGRSAFAASLEHAGQSYGAIVVSVPPMFVNDAEACSLFEELAGDLGFALHKIAVAEALHESDERLSATLRSIGDAVITTDVSGKVVNLNPVAESLTGCRINDALGKPVSDIFHIIQEGTKMPAQSPVERALREGVIVGLANHTLLIAADGTERPIADSAAPILGAQGQCFGVVLVFRDQTNERLAEKKLQESEERFRTIFETVPVSVFIHDKDSAEIIDANRKAIESYGFSTLDEIKTHDFWSDPPYSAAEAIQLIKKAVNEGPQRFEWRNVDRSGREFWEDISLRVTKINDKERVLAACIDITERKEAEELANINHLRLISILDASPDPIYVADPDTYELLYANRALIDAIGMPNRQKCYEYLQNRKSPCPFCSNDQIFGKNFGKTLVWEFENKNNNRWYRCCDRAITWPDGRIVRYEMAVDITDRKNAEDSLLNSLREKETLLRELYHRTKNNMQVIRSMLAMQSAQTDSKEVEKVFRETGNRIHAMSLVHEKLYQTRDLSRIDMPQYVKELAELLVKSYNVDGTIVKVVTEVEPIKALIDVAIPFGLILNELISNSLKYAFKGRDSGTITIRVFRPDSGSVELFFADNGVGVPSGFDFREQKTVGLQIILALAEQQLQGTVQFDLKNGLSCCIRFADSSYKARI